MKRALPSLLLVAVALAHVPGMRTGFLSDDFMILGHVHETGVAHQWTHPFLDLVDVRFFRPVLTSSYAADHAAYGLDPWGYHATNVLLHVVVVASSIVLARQLGGGRTGGLVAGALIGLHALNANTVTWIAGRVSLLGVACSLVALVAFIAHRRRPRTVTAAAATLALATGLLAKESTLAIPFLWLVADVVLSGRRAWRLLAVGFVLLGATLVLRQVVLGTPLGGYGAEPTPLRVEDLLRTAALAVAPFTESGWFAGSEAVAVPTAIVAWLAVVAAWFGRGARAWRGVVVASAFGAAMVAVLYGSGLRMALENAERWYPALAALALAQGIVCANAGRVGVAVGVVAAAVGVPALLASERDYASVGDRVRLVVDAVHAAPDDRPVLVHKLPLTRDGAPFLHFGLREACAPPFRATARRDVLAIHEPYATLGDAPHPAAWALASHGPLTAIICGPDGGPMATLDRRAVLGIDGFAGYARAERATLVDGPSWPKGWCVSGGRPGERIECFLVAPIGTARFDGTVGADGRFDVDWRARGLNDFLRDPARLFIALIGGAPGAPRALAFEATTR